MKTETKIKNKITETQRHIAKYVRLYNREKNPQLKATYGLIVEIYCGFLDDLRDIFQDFKNLIF